MKYIRILKILIITIIGLTSYKLSPAPSKGISTSCPTGTSVILEFVFEVLTLFDDEEESTLSVSEDTYFCGVLWASGVPIPEALSWSVFEPFWSSLWKQFS